MKWSSALLLLAALGGITACNSGSSHTPGLTNPGPTSPPNDSISGTVSFKGAPIAGATVTAWLTNTNKITGTATTDANGHYSFSDLSAWQTVPAVYQFWATKPGYGFYPTVSAPGEVMRFDHTGNYQGNGVTDTAIYLTVIQFTAAPNTNITDADFSAYDGTAPLVSLPRTGQTTSFVDGDDASAAKGVSWPQSRFKNNQDGTVTDRLTGLIWLQDAGCFAPTLWATAVADANQLASGACGLTDGSKPGQWRMPNINELESLIDVSASNPALPAGNPFTNVSNAIYWTSTSYFGGQAGSPTAWVIRMGDGRYMNDSGSNVKATQNNGVWAVKGTGSGGAIKLQATGAFVPFAPGDDGTVKAGVPATFPRYFDNGNGTITDTVTGLVWLKQANCIQQSWSDAIAAVRSLASGQCGLTDGTAAGAWRVPNRTEMQSLSDRAENNLAAFLDHTYLNWDGTLFLPAIFSNFVERQFYWTSSTDAANPAEAWTVFSCDFGVYDVPKENIGYTLAVR